MSKIILDPQKNTYHATITFINNSADCRLTIISQDESDVIAQVNDMRKNKYILINSVLVWKEKKAEGANSVTVIIDE